MLQSWGSRSRHLVAAASLCLAVLAASCTPAANTRTRGATSTPAATEPTAPAAAAEVAPGDPVNQVAIAGIGGTVFAAIFAPSEVTIPTGSTLTWSNLGDWPHQVVFLGSSGALPPLARGQTEFTRPATVDVSKPVGYDGVAFLHSGLLERGGQISVTFTTDGTFPYLCPIHPRMAGSVRVVPRGQPFTTARQAAESARVQRDAVVDLAEPERDVAMNLYALSARKPDNSTLWSVPVGPRIGTPTGFLEVAEFIPTDLKVKAGDSVRWYFFTPHTVTFVPSGQALPELQPPATRSGVDFDGRVLVNSGILAFTAADGLRFFEQRFPRPGTYEYVCFLHFRAGGQKGTITVE